MQQEDSKSNGYGILRLIFAMSVVYSHSFALCGSKDVDLVQRITGHSASHFGVMGFFILSGYLNAQSLARQKSDGGIAWTFLVRRGFRIFPLLWTMILMTALLYILLAATGSIASNRSPGAEPQALGLLAAFKNAFRFFQGNFIPWAPHYQLEGVFADNPNQAICGSLWTLPYEIVFYLILSTAPTIRRLGRIQGKVLIIALAAFSIYASNDSPSSPPLIASFQSYWLGTLGFAFLVGVALCHMSRHLCAMVIGGITLGVYFRYGLVGYGAPARALETVAWGLVVVGVGAFPLGVVSRISQRWDPSYGIYLLSYPIQQMLVAQGTVSTMKLLISSSLITISGACLSWMYVEKPMLQLGQRISVRYAR